MTKLHRKERVIRAIHHQLVDRPPKGELCIDDEVVGAYFDTSSITHGHRRRFVELLDMDLICITPEYPVAKQPNHLPDPNFTYWPDLQRWAQETDIFPFVLLEGAFGWGVRRWGFERFILQVVKKDTDVVTFTRHVEVFNDQLARNAAQNGAAGVVFADDIAYQNGLIISPELLRIFFSPSYKAQVQRFKSYGLHTFFHSDGNLNEILDDILDSGFEGLQCIEEAADMDLAGIKEKYRSRLCLWGNLDPIYLTESLPHSAVEDKVRDIIHSGAEGGGFIFGTSSGLFKGVRVDLLRRAYLAAG